MDTVGDFLTVLRNAIAAHLPSVVVPSSHLRREISRILKNAGYVDAYEETVCSLGRRVLRVTPRYVNGKSLIQSIRRCSRPGRRMYCQARCLSRVLNGLGIAIISTSAGLMRDSEARRKNLGGEILCEVW
ncbi:MAG: 30S ribosomal protein S8 [Puniceicoccales bacterium]|jgi:small subunit ribosomal protein S8|nr:30S ribosomal protein S8 [Puniceicoccales bacterium]